MFMIVTGLVIFFVIGMWIILEQLWIKRRHHHTH